MTDVNKKRMGSMMVSGEGNSAEPWADFDAARVETFLRLVTLQLTATTEERDLMRAACDVLAPSTNISDARDEPRKFSPLDEWKMVLEVCIGELAYDDKETLTVDDEWALAAFVEERLSVLTCGGLFRGSRQRAGSGLRAELVQ